MSTKDLKNEKAWNKLKDLAEDIDFAMMETNLGGRPSHIIPMSTKKVDDEGNVWFLSAADSDHNQFINKDNAIQLIYSKPGEMEYMVIYGKAFIYTDKKIIKEFYSKTDDSWFNGIDDPNVSAIKIIPEEGYYWDTKNGKLTTMLKIGIGAITGKQKDVGVKGELHI